MGKTSKGFGDLLKLERQKGKNSAKSNPKMTILAKNQNDESYVEYNFEEQEQRIGTIVGFDDDGEVLSVNAQTLTTFRNYLEQNLTSPCTVTGIEDFQWEEYYIIGPGSKKEHERLRKTKPSYRDTYEFLGFDDEVEDEFYSLLVNVRRTSDKKKFCLPLSDLKATSEDTKNYQLLDDYSVWFVNWR
ncbi:MAG: calcium-binding protein [Waterburya sp.]